MKKMLVLFLGSCSLMACASWRPVNWTGQNFDNYVLSQGVPTSQYTSTNGNTIYSFKKTCESDPAKVEETLVIVGGDNLIQSISTPIGCPFGYDSDSPAHNAKQGTALQEKSNKKRIEYLEQAVKGAELNISYQQQGIKFAQFDIDQAIKQKDNAARAEAEQKLKKAQEELKKDEKYKEQWEREIRQLQSIRY